MLFTSAPIEGHMYDYVSTLVECDNAPVEPDKWNGSETGRE